MLRFFLRLPGISRLHERQWLFPVLVLVVVAGVLVQGALERTATAEREPPLPDTEPATTLPTPVVARPALRGDLEKTPLTYFSDYWAQLGEEARDHIVLVGPGRHAGVLIEPGLALASIAAAETIRAEAARVSLARAAVEAPSTDGAEVTAPDLGGAGVRGLDREVGLALVEVPETTGAFAVGDARALPPASYVGVVTRDLNGRVSITPGSLVSVAGAGVVPDGVGDLAVTTPPVPPGVVAAVIDLDGELVGVTYIAPDGPRTLSARAMRRVVDRMHTETACRAIDVAAPAAGVLDLLGVGQGLVIERVMAQAFLPVPSLEPGDLLLEWDGEAVTTVEAFGERYDTLGPGTLARYLVLRGRRRLSGGTLIPDRRCQPVEQAPLRLVRLGVAFEWAESPAGAGWTVMTVAPGGPADLAGVVEADRLIAIDGTAAERRDVRRALERLAERSQSILLTLGRDGRVTLAAVAPPE